jgi:hypothetical protein
MTWRKSSFTETGTCVEIRSDLAAVRDSKQPEVVMPISKTALSRFTAFARERTRD